MAGPISYIGGKLWVKAELPTAYTTTAYAALTWVEVKGVVDIGEIGDQQNDITIDALDGRVQHANGSSDLGEIPVTLQFIHDDAGQVVIRANAGTNADISFRIDDPDGQKKYFSGKLANLRDRARSSTEYKGDTFVIRGNTAVVKTAPT